MNNHFELTFSVYTIILISIFVSSISYWYLKPKSQLYWEKRSIFLDIRFWIPCLLYTFLLGFRWNYAYDWWQYYKTFEYIQNGLIYRENTEQGYLFINYILGQIGLNFYSIFILECFTFYTSIFLLLKHDRKAMLVGLCLVFIEMRFRCLNLSRQHFAMSVLWIGFYYLLNAQKKKYIIFAIIASSIHSTAIIWSVALYLLRYLKIDLGYKYSIGIFALCHIFKAYVFEYLIKASSFVTQYIISNKAYDETHMLSETFAWDDLTGTKLYIYIFKGLSYVILMEYCLQNNLIHSNKDKIILFFGYIGVCLSVFGTSHEIISRFVLYVVVFKCLGWGIIVKSLLDKRLKVPILLYGLVAITFLHYLYSYYPVIKYEVMENHIFINYKFLF